MSNPCNDTWTGKDKALHFGVCLVLAIIYPLIAIMAAAGKELYDMKQNGNHFCWKDIVADVAGVVLGTVVHAGLHWLFG